jgi:hypothetical protein
MTFEERISAFNELGQFFNFILNKDSIQEAELKQKFENWEEEADFAIRDAEAFNNWFTKDSINLALQSWAEALTVENLKTWTADYAFAENPKNVGIIMAGNLPLVGFHDLLSVVISGHNALVKTSSKDDKLMRFVIKFLQSTNEELKNVIQVIDRLSNFDAVIATGSNNTSRYFEQYFGKVPNIIRKNRTSVAVLNGSETEEDLQNLGKDIFIYFGLGCRNVTKLYVKDEAQLPKVFEGLFSYGNVINHSKYANNYDYNRAIYLLGKDEFLDNNFVLLKKDDNLHSPIAVVNFEVYTYVNDVKQYLSENEEQIQCVIGNEMQDNPNYVEFGQTQFPKLTDYADNIDTLKFLAEL